MKKLITLFICSLFIVNCDSNSVEMANYENNVATAKKFYKETKGKIEIIGVGGVDSGESAFEKITAGADAVQLYTGMVYKGPGC